MGNIKSRPKDKESNTIVDASDSRTTVMTSEGVSNLSTGMYDNNCRC